MTPLERKGTFRFAGLILLHGLYFLYAVMIDNALLSVVLFMVFRVGRVSTQCNRHMSLKAVVAAYADGRLFYMNSLPLRTFRGHESGGGNNE